jgi:hypothetical protein
MSWRPAWPLLITLLAVVACAPGADPDAGTGRPPASPSLPTGTAAPSPTGPPASPSPDVGGGPRTTPGLRTPGPSPTTGRSRPPDQVSAFTNPGELATALADAEAAIRAPDTPPADIAGWAWLQQQAYRDLAVHPEWRDRAKAALPTGLHAAFDANVHATEQLRALTEPRDELPPWRIVAPPPAAELRAHYAAAAEEFGVGWEYLAAIHLVESRMGRIRGLSTAGAKGPMQFLPSTWEAFGEGDIENPRDAIRAAARYLVAHGAPDDMRGALFAYNHSDLYVDGISRYASVMRADERTYLGYYHWRVYYRTTNGDVILDEGYDAR